jgi:hypothetical protein
MVQRVCAPVPKVGGYIGLKGHFCVGFVGFAGFINLFFFLKKKKKKKKNKIYTLQTLHTLHKTKLKYSFLN